MLFNISKQCVKQQPTFRQFSRFKINWWMQPKASACLHMSLAIYRCVGFFKFKNINNFISFCGTSRFTSLDFLTCSIFSISLHYLTYIYISIRYNIKFLLVFQLCDSRILNLNRTVWLNEILFFYKILELLSVMLYFVSCTNWWLLFSWEIKMIDWLIDWLIDWFE